MQNNFPHLVVIYAFLALLAVALIYFQAVGGGPSAGDWQCSNVVCSQVMGPEPWIAENCFETPSGPADPATGATGTTTVCRVVVENQNRLVPLAELNLTNLRVCTQYTCVQEVNVRGVNYTVNVTQ